MQVDHGEDTRCAAAGEAPSQGDRESDAVIRDTGRLGDLGRSGLLDGVPEAVFDDAVRLASRLLQVPVGLLSLVTKDRQVFKAQHGLTGWAAEEGGTPLTHSFCQHVVSSGEALRVEDARSDRRVRGNLAVRDLDVIAYLGVPVRAPGGAVLGSFCAIDGRPRGWSDEDRETLQTIARGIESEIALRLALRDVADERERLRTVLDELPVGVAVASVPDGRIELVNSTGERLLADEIDVENQRDYARLGAQHSDGRRYRPEDYPLVRTAVSGEAIENEPLIYRRGDGELIDLEVSSRRIPTVPPSAVATFVDVAERNRARAAAAASEAKLRHALEASADGIFVLDREWRFTFLNDAARKMIAGGRDLEGLVIWDVFPEAVGGPLWTSYREAMTLGEPRRAEQHYAPLDAWFEARSYPDEEGLTVYFRDVTEQRRAEDARQILVQELNHRVKNLFAVVSGMVGMTARATSTSEQMAEALRGRIAALARAHDLIRPAVAREDQSRPRATLQALLSAILEPHLSHASDLVEFRGPAVTLGAGGMTSVSLVVHELATNAAKYGALSVPDGALSVTWVVRDERLEVLWNETVGRADAPSAAAPGFGSRLIEMSVEAQMRGTIEREWTPQGLRVRLAVPLESVQR
jgi:PAS domain S-box-containing protein